MKVIELNIHNRKRIRIFDLCLGIVLLVFFIDKVISTFGEEISSIDIFSLIIYPFAGIF